MPLTLQPIPLASPFVDVEGDTPGALSELGRLRIQQLSDNAPINSLIATPIARAAQAAAIVTTNAYVVVSDGLYEISFYMRKTTADGVSSSLIVTLGWTESGLPLTEAQTALTTDATTAEQSVSKLVHADAATAITFAVSYNSNTPGAMHFRIDVCVRKLA